VTPTVEIAARANNSANSLHIRTPIVVYNPAIPERRPPGTFSLSHFAYGVCTPLRTVIRAECRELVNLEIALGLAAVVVFDRAFASHARKERTFNTRAKTN